MLRPTRSSLAGFAAPALGFALGAALVFTYSDRAAPLRLVWAPLGVALSTAAGAVFTYGRRRWADLCDLHTVRARDVAGPVLAIEIGAIAAVNITPLFYGTADGTAREYWRGGALVTLALVLAAPAAGVMFGVRHVARDKSLSDSPGKRLALLVALRRLLERLLVAVGALVALATLQEGALIALERSVHPQLVSRPPQYILVFGGFGSFLAGLVYVPAWATLRDRGLQLCDELFSMEGLDDGQAILSMAGDRQKLEQILGVDRNVLADLQTGLAILAPLLAGAAAAFLPH